MESLWVQTDHKLQFADPSPKLLFSLYQDSLGIRKNNALKLPSLAHIESQSCF